MAGSILYATDFSPNSELALRYACSLAAHGEVDLHIVHVSEALPTLDNPTPAYHTMTGILAAETTAKTKLDQVQPTCPGVRAVRHVLHGDPADEIIRFAVEYQVDLIVLGTHGRTGLTKLLMGSVAEGVVSGATCPVLVVKNPMKNQEG